MARGARQASLALPVTGRLHQADRLESDERRVIGTDHGAVAHLGQSMAGPAHSNLIVGLPVPESERHRQGGFIGPTPSGLDVGPTRSVATLAADVGDHRGLVENERPPVRCDRRVALEALEREPRRVAAPRRPHPRPVGASGLALSGCDVGNLLVGVNGQPMLEHRGSVRSAVCQRDESGRVMARSERILDHESFDRVGFTPFG